MRKSVAIIIRTKDRPILLQRAIQSVARQTFLDWVIVIVNDGGRPALVEQTLNQFESTIRQKCLTIHNDTSIGMQNASNQGVAACDSSYVVIHDDDDSWEPTFLEESVTFLENPPDPIFQGVITHSTRIVEEIRGDRVVEIHRESFNAWMQQIQLFRLLEENTFPPISFLFKRSAMEKVGPFEQRWNPLGDWEFNVRFLLEFEIGVIPKPLANYHHRIWQDTSNYQNSVNIFHGQNSHRYYEAMLRNHWLRNDLREGTIGLGVTSSISKLMGNTWTIAHILQGKLCK